MSSRQPDEERVFHLARGIGDPSLRKEYLDQICAGNRELQERVEALLNVHNDEREFLKPDIDTAATVERTPLTEHPGTAIGRYKLMEQIGEGGMGTVFVAEQDRPPIRSSLAQLPEAVMHPPRSFPSPAR